MLLVGIIDLLISFVFLLLLIKANEFIRDVFELGPPMLVDSATMKAMKISRFERVCVHAQVIQTAMSL